ncbi:hypothetical protein [Streptomyces xantholiticus]|uniref:hypothetical protein n=1 Tax=Streptomyces xantholiticus TaxID=68285 RepID=UPI0016799C98|nr:hypothetical protein [Streptomyces xantholiticus]
MAAWPVAGGRGEGDGGGEIEAFGIQPGRGGGAVGETVRDTLTGQSPQVVVSGVGGVPVVLKQTAEGLLPGQVGVLAPALVIGVQAGQVVHAPAAGADGLLADQSGPCQSGQALPGRPHRLAGQGSCGVGGQVGTGVERQQPKQPRRLIVHPPVGQIEGSLHPQGTPALLLVAEGLQAGTGVGEVGGQGGQGQSGVGGELGGGDRQHQRQVPAVCGHLPQGLGLLARAGVFGPGPCEGAGDEVGGRLGIELAQGDQSGREIRAGQRVAGGGQQPVPAGDPLFG